MNDHELLLAIQELLSATTWTPATIDEVADLLEANGYHIEDIDDQ